MPPSGDRSGGGFCGALGNIWAREHFRFIPAQVAGFQRVHAFRPGKGAGAAEASMNGLPEHSPITPGPLTPTPRPFP